jgi:hypothetical protein
MSIVHRKSSDFERLLDLRCMAFAARGGYEPVGANPRVEERDSATRSPGCARADAVPGDVQ